MKQCPACNREYDDTLRFCLADGATLIRIGEPPGQTMTMPAQASFQPPPAPTLPMPVKPSLSTAASLANIFFAPARVFASFRDLTTFGPAVVRFLLAAAIIVISAVTYQAVYLARIGSESIARANVEVTPRVAELPSEQKERALQFQQQPTFQAISILVRFSLLIVFLVVSLPVGGLIYWLGVMIFKQPMTYMQALLVWTYATLPPVGLKTLVNTLVVLIYPPVTNIGIATGAEGVLHANLGALFEVTTLPVPVYIVALSALDLFAFYGLALAIVGLRKVPRIPWIGAFGIVIFVWLIGVVWQVATAGLAVSLMK